MIGYFSTVADLVAALAARQVSAAELLDRAITRIEAFDGGINAVVVRDFERARISASEADKALARGERRPLLGIPMTVKESHNVAGLPTTWGNPAFKGCLAAEDSVAVARLKAAGAIIIGKTNVPLMLADWQSYNGVYGTTNNPWDPGLTPGGSSGGSAAALAAGFTPLELGSDIGGSLRSPAACCGVFAHKPTTGLVPLRGMIPPHTPPSFMKSDLAVIGPMARSATDLEMALGVIAGPDEPDAIAYRLALPAPRHERLADYRILVVDRHPLLATSAGVTAAIEHLAETLGRAGAKVGRTSRLLPDLTTIVRTHTFLLAAIRGASIPTETYRSQQKVASQIDINAMDSHSISARGTVINLRDWLAANRTRARVAQGWRDFFCEWDVLLCPCAPTTAFPHNHTDIATRQIDIDGKRYPYRDQRVWFGIATLTGQPATVIPIALSDEGLPVGVQLIGPFLEDRTTLRLAALLERELGGFIAPPGFQAER